MKKKIKDVTFKEFDKWANMRACDGGWDFYTALASVEAIGKVLEGTRNYSLAIKTYDITRRYSFENILSIRFKD